MLRLSVISIILFYLAISNSLFSQCDRLIELSLEALEDRDYQLAIERLLDTRDNCPSQAKKINKMIKQAFDQIEGEKNQADSMRQSLERNSRIMAEILKKERTEDLEEIKRGKLPELYVLAIGIDNYKGVPLKSCVNDANLVIETWGRSNPLFGQVHNYRLVNEQATKRIIRNRIQELVSQSGPNDLVYIHISGHGYLNGKAAGSFVTADFDPGIRDISQQKEFQISGEELFSWLKEEDAFVLLFLDFDGGAQTLEPFQKATKSFEPKDFLHKVFGFGINGHTITKEYKGKEQGFLSSLSCRSVGKYSNDTDENGVLYMDEFYWGLTREFTEAVESNQFSRQFLAGDSEKGEKLIEAAIPATIANIPIRQFGISFELPKEEKPITSTSQP